MLAGCVCDSAQRIVSGCWPHGFCVVSFGIRVYKELSFSDAYTHTFAYQKKEKIGLRVSTPQPPCTKNHQFMLHIIHVYVHTYMYEKIYIYTRVLRTVFFDMCVQVHFYTYVRMLHMYTHIQRQYIHIYTNITHICMLHDHAHSKNAS